MKEKLNKIRTVKLYDLKTGGEGASEYSEKNLHHLYVLEIPIFNPDNNFEIVKDYFKTNNPKKLIEIAENSMCDIIGLNFNCEDLEDAAKAQELLKELLPLINKPLMIRAFAELLIKLAEILDRECILAYADENNYKKIVPYAIKGNHVLVIKTPIDINLAKEMNILTSDMGLRLDKILIDTDTGGLGYGLEYGYSIMEKIKLEGFFDDEYLNMPLISFIGEESLKTKEAKSKKFQKSWGDFKTRSLMFEIASASAIAAAGANIIVLNHPETIRTMKGLQR